MAGHFLYLKIIKIRILLKTWFDIYGNIADFFVARYNKHILAQVFDRALGLFILILLQTGVFCGKIFL